MYWVVCKCLGLNLANGFLSVNLCECAKNSCNEPRLGQHKGPEAAPQQLPSMPHCSGVLLSFSPPLFLTSNRHTNAQKGEKEISACSHLKLKSLLFIHPASIWIWTKWPSLAARQPELCINCLHLLRI